MSESKSGRRFADRQEGLAAASASLPVVLAPLVLITLGNFRCWIGSLAVPGTLIGPLG